MADQKGLIPGRENPGASGFAADPTAKVSIKRIMVPTDLTPHGERAVNYGLMMARCFQAELTLVHVYDPGNTYAEPQEIVKNLKVLSANLQNKYAEINFTVGVGAPYLQIPALAKELHADLMVISRHHYTCLERLIFGAEAGKIAQRTLCPVLVVPEDEQAVLGST